MAKAVAGRQLWIGGVAKWCDHNVIEHVQSAGGKTLADVCKACQMRIAEYGACDGCKRERRLTKFVVAKRLRYCTPDCYQAVQKAKRTAEAELRRATTPPKVTP